MPWRSIQITCVSGIHCFFSRAGLFNLFTLTVMLLIAHPDGQAQTPPTGHTFTLTIDPGHGGRTPGAVGKKAKEKDITLSIALKFGKLVETEMPDVKVVYTRKEDLFVPLDERAAIANRNKSDLFVSIHTNANEKQYVYGSETYVMGLSKSQDNMNVVMKENQEILLEEDYQTKYGGFDPNSALSYIKF
ncbi:MAG: N-acetylmuramoyl-L-alanine amidase, partial [Bacteroidales bacterium]